MGGRQAGRKHAGRQANRKADRKQAGRQGKLMVFSPLLAELQQRVCRLSELLDTLLFTAFRSSWTHWLLWETGLLGFAPLLPAPASSTTTFDLGHQIAQKSLGNRP